MIFILPVGYAETQKIYTLDLNYNQGTVTKELLFVTQGYFKEQKGSTEDYYSLELISFEGTILHTQRFNFPLEIFGAPNLDWFDEAGNQIYIPTAEESGYALLDEAIARLIIPYFKNGKGIIVYNSEKNKILEIDISSYSDVCGDRVCQEHESYSTCQQDCPSDFQSIMGKNQAVANEDVSADNQEGFAAIFSSKISEPINPFSKPLHDSKVQKEKGNSVMPILVGIVILAVIIFLIMIFRIKHKQHDTSQLQQLQKYVTTNLKKGYTKQQIRQNLLKAGWEQDIVDKARGIVKKK